MTEDEQPKPESPQPVDRAKMPRWMQWAVGLFMAYLVYTGFQKEDQPEGGEQQTEQSESKQPERYGEIKKFADINRWRLYANPGLGREIEFVDTVAGTGDTAQCGQQVVLDIQTAPGHEDQPSQWPEMPLTFLVGVDVPAIGEAAHRAVLGMRQGGKRDVLIGARLFDRDADVNAEAFGYVLTLEKLSPDAGEGVGFSASAVAKGKGNPASCDETIAILPKVWSADNRSLYRPDAEKPFIIHIGRSELGHGIDRGLVGIREGEIRRLVIPPAYLPKKSDIPFPKGEIAIVELMRVSYKNNDLPEPEIPADHDATPNPYLK